MQRGLLLLACGAEALRSKALDRSAPRLTLPWTGSHGGLPPLHGAAMDEFEPALKFGLERQRGDIDAIAKNPDPPSFNNTIAALEASGQELQRAQTVYSVYLSSMSTPALRDVESRMAGTLAAAGDHVYQNDALFQRIRAVYGSPSFKSLGAEQRRLTWKYHDNFRRHGAELSPQNKSRLAELNQELAAEYTHFNHHLMAEEDTFVLVDDASRLAGVEPELRAALAAAAAENGHQGKWAVANTRSVVEPFLAQAEDRKLREQVWRRFVQRGDNDNANDNKKGLSRILELRLKRASLLGYKTHAHWQLENAMAGKPERVLALLHELWGPAVAAVRKDVKAQQSIADGEDAHVKIEPWDYRFYMEKVRLAEFDLDAAMLKPYLQLDHLREGMFWSAKQLFGLRFTEMHDVPVAHMDTRVWEVNSSSGQVLGLYYFDPYSRPGKRSGAWMSSYRDQQKYQGRVLPIVSNNCNYVKPADGQPALMSWDDAATMFHEFGHALHGLLSDVDFPSLAGTSVARDYVEFPSQLYEHWLTSAQLLERFALHYESGEAMPRAMVEKVLATETFNMGFKTVEYLASAFMDMELHMKSGPVDATSAEGQILDRLGMPHEIVMRHRLPQFAHAFGSDGYSAAYYSYLWADTLTADAAAAFDESGNLFDGATSQRLLRDVLSVGNSLDPAEGFRRFRGRDVELQALMRHRGFA